MLAHDSTATPRTTQTGCSGSLPTLADDVVARRQRVGRRQRHATPTRGGVGGTPPLTTTAQTNVRQKLQQVEFALNQSGTNTAPTTDVGGGLHRGSLAPGDWIEFNGPINLLNIDSVTFRVADTAGGRTAGLAAGGGRAADRRADGPIVPTANLTSTGGTAAWAEPDVPADRSGRHEPAVPRVPARARRPGREQPVQPQLGAVQRRRASPSSGRTSPATSAARSRRRCRWRSGRRRRSGRSRRASARTYETSMAAKVISSAGDATLSVVDPSSNAGRLVNGAFALAQPLMVRANAGAFAPVGGTRRPCSPTAGRCPTTR